MDRGLARWQSLASRLGQLHPRLGTAFAAGCAERALSVLDYDGFSDDPGFMSAFRAAVEVVWQAASGSRVPSEQLARARGAVEKVFPEGDHYSGFQATVSAGAGVLRALDAVQDLSGRAVTDVSLHVSSAYEQLTECDAEPTDDMGWQELAVERLESWGEQSLTRAIFAGLPPPPSDQFGVL